VQQTQAQATDEQRDRLRDIPRFEPRLAARGALFELVHLRRPASIRLQLSGLEARLRRAFY
jgi:hypothetical protein